MTVSFVLRLVPGSPDGIAGEIEDVETGERTVIRNDDDLLAHLRQATMTRGARDVQGAGEPG